MLLEKGGERKKTFDITNWFVHVYVGGYTYFYSKWDSDYYYPSKPFAFSSCSMSVPNLFKVTPSKIEDRNNLSIITMLDFRDRNVVEKLLLPCIDVADRMDREKGKITAMTPFILNKDVVDIYGIEFDIEYMPEYVILPSGSSMRDNYSDEILSRYLEYLNNSYSKLSEK